MVASAYATVAQMRVHTHAETRDRTGDLQIFSLTLSQLSYRGNCTADAPNFISGRMNCRIYLNHYTLLARTHLIASLPEWLRGWT